MQALGLIETLGLLPAIECADVMLKTAQVELAGRTFVGGGLVTIAVTGDVGAVKAAVESGAAAVEKISHLSLVSQHVIPRPYHDIKGIIVESVNLDEEQLILEPQEEKSNFFATESTETVAPTKESTDTEPIAPKSLHKEEMDAFVRKFGLEKSLEVLKSLSVVKLRHLAREYKELDLAGRAISKANKDLLIQQFKGYYERGITK